MDEELEFEFNDKVMKALMKKVQDSNTRCAAIEKDLGVKEAELQYLAKLYDEETTSLTQKLENEEKKAKKFEEELNEIKASLLKKEEKIIVLSSKVEEIDNIKVQLEIANNKINNQQNLISQQETRIREMSEEIKNKNIIIKEQTALYETLQMELKEYKGPEAIADENSAGDRLKCAKCGSVGKDIKVVEDRAKALSYVGNMPMYAKYHVCKRCGFQF